MSLLKKSHINILISILTPILSAYLIHIFCYIDTVLLTCISMTCNCVTLYYYLFNLFVLLIKCRFLCIHLNLFIRFLRDKSYCPNFIIFSPPCHCQCDQLYKHWCRFLVIELTIFLDWLDYGEILKQWFTSDIPSYLSSLSHIPCLL